LTTEVRKQNVIVTVCIEITDKRVMLFIVLFEREIFKIDMSRKFELVAK
jgi:hypothetical protein